ncbi:MAG: metallopeptidase family protein [Gammaproteobacteria bacterium]
MDKKSFEKVVHDMLEELPQWAIDRIENLRVIVEELPTSEQDPEGSGLLGLYEGIPLHERGPEYYAELPDTVFIFRRPHLQLDLPEAELCEEIRRTVLHELAHYFGMDDDHLDDIGWG